MTRRRIDFEAKDEPLRADVRRLGELGLAGRQLSVSNQACPECSAEGHDTNAVHCKFCGAKL